MREKHNGNQGKGENEMGEMTTTKINGMAITEINDGQYRVESNSGNTYTVKYCGSGDGDPEYCALWECDCPAGQYGRTCKHVKAVTALVDEDDD